ncbi:MAG: DUF1631 domain-containing protein [Ectothiorhodospiraceae bacterium]|jgi:hypothetical protein
MAHSDNVVYLQPGTTPAAGRETLDRLRGLSAQRLAAVVRSTMDQVDDALFDRAERAGSHTDQEMYFAAMRQIRLQRREVENGFIEAVHHGFRGLLETDSSGSAEDATAADPLDLELVDDAAVEESVAIDTMASKLRGRCSLPLSQLTARLDALVSEREVNADVSPLDPRQLATGFEAAVSAVDVPIQPRLILYKVFEKQLLQQLPALYEAANQHLAGAGVLPDVRPGVKRSPGGRDTSASAGAESAGEASEPTLEALRSLLAEAKYGGEVSGQAPSGQVDAAGLLAALSALQHQETEIAEGDGPGGADAGDIKAALARLLPAQGRGGRPDLGRNADDTIDIVSMLFDVILGDPRLPGAIKALIARLQIPVLKVALLDREFLSRRQHPARQLINEMAHAAVGWNEPEDPDGDPLYRKMNESVERIIDGFEDDIRVFDATLRDFRAFVQREQERARAIEERTRQAAEGKARVDDSRERVQQEVEQRLATPDLPDVVRRVLEEAWFKVLFITLVREGADSDAWANQVAVMDRLVWSVQPNKTAGERKQMLNEMPALLQDLREGLNAIMFNPFEMTRLFKELEQVHIGILSRPAARQPEQPQPARPESPGGESALAKPVREDGPATAGGAAEGDVGNSAEDAEAGEDFRRLRELDLGTWFEFHDNPDKAVRAKLSARLNGGKRFIFVNRAGFKLADKPITTLVEELRDGRVVVLDDNMLFDRALENVVSSLRDMRDSR